MKITQVTISALCAAMFLLGCSTYIQPLPKQPGAGSTTDNKPADCYTALKKQHDTVVRRKYAQGTATIVGGLLTIVSTAIVALTDTEVKGDPPVADDTQKQYLAGVAAFGGITTLAASLLGNTDKANERYSKTLSNFHKADWAACLGI